jgi:hypothetical protein
VKLLTSGVFIVLLVGCASTDKLGYQGNKMSSSKSPNSLQVLESLKSNPAAVFRIQNGWTIVNVDNEQEKSIYSFTPESHPAYPSIVKREIVEKDGSIHINMTAKCGATKDICDKLVQQFIALNDKVKQSMQ